MPIYDEFYDACRSIASKSVLPLETNAIVFDDRFNEESVINDLKRGFYPFAFDYPVYYQIVISNIWYHVRHNKDISFICDSDELQEPPNRADFIYYAGSLDSNIGVLFMAPRHQFYYPYRAILYGQEYQFEFGQDWQEVKMFPVNHSIRKIMMIPNEKERIRKVTKYLRETDRPVIPYYEALI